MDLYNILIRICVNAIPLILAITLHEAAHGYVAKMFGDNTAYMLGRVTLNPAKHIDPVGTIAFPLISMIVGGIHLRLGEAGAGEFRQPAPSQARHAVGRRGGPGLEPHPGARLGGRSPRLIVSSAVARGSPNSGSRWRSQGSAGTWCSPIFNLFPILPLDGGRIVTSLLPNRLAYSYSRLEPYGMPILIGLIILMVAYRVLGQVLCAAPERGLALFFYSLFGLQ